MTIDEYKIEYPRETVFIQTDDAVRIMTPEEYEHWVAECVHHINNPSIP